MMFNRFTVTGPVETADNGYTAEASTIGLPAGEWPFLIVVPGIGQFQFSHRRTTVDGELTSVVYRIDHTTALTIWND